jgi:hypothetical protein
VKEEHERVAHAAERSRGRKILYSRNKEIGGVVGNIVGNIVHSGSSVGCLRKKNKSVFRARRLFTFSKKIKCAEAFPLRRRFLGACWHCAK